MKSALLWVWLFVLGAFDRSTPLCRVLLILPALIYCAISWPRIMFSLHTGDKADKNQLAKHFFGFCDPALTWSKEGSFSHRAIDYLVEWVRLNQQRAAKAGSFVILVLVVVAAIGWAI